MKLFKNILGFVCDCIADADPNNDLITFKYSRAGEIYNPESPSAASDGYIKYHDPAANIKLKTRGY